MTLEYRYFPVYTFVLCVLVLYSLYRGYKKGFFFKLLDLAVLLAALFIAWPAGQALAEAYPIFFGYEPGNWILSFFNTAIWFFIVEILLRVLAGLIYKTVKWLHKIKIFGFFDRLLGLLLSVVTTFISLCLLVMFLELPIINNGSIYVQDSPLRYVKEAMEHDIPFLLEDYYA